MYDDNSLKQILNLWVLDLILTLKNERKCLSWIDIGYPKSDVTVESAIIGSSERK